MATKTVLPQDAAERKATPVVSGVLDYFPAALAEVARVSKAGNDQHNPGQPLHWARGKSMDHADALARHLLERGTVDTDGIRHSAKMAWRALALLQEELEAAGAPLARGANVSEDLNKVPSGPDDWPADLRQPGATPARGAQATVVMPSGPDVWYAVMSGDLLWSERVTARDQGARAVHAVGVCTRCDQTYKSTSEIDRHCWYTLLPVHTAD